MAKDTWLDPAAQGSLLQVVEGEGQFLVPWYPSHWWDAFGLCLGLVGDAQLWALSLPSCFPSCCSSKIDVWNEGAVSGVSKRNITCCGRIFFSFFSLIFIPIIGAIPVSGTARYLAYSGKAASQQNPCDCSSYTWIPCFGASLGLWVTLYYFFF